MINNQVQQINTLTQQLQSYVKAFGDPSKLLQITGSDSLVSSLKSGGVGQMIGQLQQAASGTAALQYNANGLYQSLGGFQQSGSSARPEFSTKFFTRE